MKIEPFQMERLQSNWENLVTYNLSESGVHHLSLQEILSSQEIQNLAPLALGYIQTNGDPKLREKISGLYPGANIDNILVTTGSAEANFLLIWSSIEPGDEVVFMLPNYMQMWGLLRAFGAKVKPFYLKEDLNWNPDLKELKKIVSKETKLIIITNPNNPTGGVLGQEARDTLINLAEWADAWILSDEVYRGAELNGSLTPSFWGSTKKVVATSGLSKAYGLSGLRTGWIVGPEDFIQKTWPYHDYTSISLSAVSNLLAQRALTPEKRKKILERTRKILNKNLSHLQAWLDKQDGLFHLVPPQAGAIAFARYNLDIDSVQLVTRIRKEKSVLLVPGKHFGMDNYLRFGYGIEEETLLKSLSLVSEILNSIKKDLS